MPTMAKSASGGSTTDAEIVELTGLSPATIRSALGRLQPLAWPLLRIGGPSVEASQSANGPLQRWWVAQAGRGRARRGR
jgi:hypothetical protein